MPIPCVDIILENAKGEYQVGWREVIAMYERY
jgi:hypothetical protein